VQRWIAAFVILSACGDAHAGADTGFYVGAAAGQFTIEIDEINFAADDIAATEITAQPDDATACWLSAAWRF